MEKDKETKLSSLVYSKNFDDGLKAYRECLVSVLDSLSSLEFPVKGTLIVDFERYLNTCSFLTSQIKQVTSFINDYSQAEPLPVDTY